MELDALSIRDLCQRGVIMHVNEVSRVKAINVVAKGHGESEECLFDVASEMEIHEA